MQLPRIVDLSMPIEPNVPRWQLEFVVSRNPHCYQATVVKLPVHVATHVDSPLHYFADGTSIDKMPLDIFIGPATIIDLTFKGENEAITSRDFEASASDIRSGDILLLRTDWPERMWGTMDFWRRAPYLARDGAEWIARKKPKMVGYDFPQDYAIRKLGDACPRAEEFVVHQVLLGCGIPNIEYLCNLGEIHCRRPTVIAFPLKLVGLEGSPARVVAIED